MNQRLDGWKLGLAILLPAALIAGAIWFALQAFGGEDSGSLATAGSTTPTPTATVVPTSVPETQAITEPTSVPTPTPLVLPTAAPTATAAPTVEATATPEPAPAPAPAPTSAPSQPSEPAPTATPTVDPDLFVVECSSPQPFPIDLEVGQELPALSASLSPPEAVSTTQFLWTFGNGVTTRAPNTGLVTYAEPGRYPISLTATNTDGRTATTTCGEVRVGNVSTSGPTNVACQIRPIASISIPWAQADSTTPMNILTTWRPASLELNLQYEFPAYFGPELVFDTSASPSRPPGRNNLLFAGRDDVIRVFWRDEATGETGRIECRAFPESTYANP